MPTEKEGGAAEKPGVTRRPRRPGAPPSDQGIARTGTPDHETVRRLGLDPDELLRKGEAAKRQ